jgi:hypothetical protein
MRGCFGGSYIIIIIIIIIILVTNSVLFVVFLSKNCYIAFIQNFLFQMTDVSMAVKINILVLWVMILYRLEGRYQRLRGTH